MPQEYLIKIVFGVGQKRCWQINHLFKPLFDGHCSHLGSPRVLNIKKTAGKPAAEIGYT